MGCDLCVLLFAAVGFTSSIALSVSVVLVYIKDWWNGRRLLAFDQILFITALTNLSLQFSISFDVSIYYAQLYVTFGNMAHMFDVAVFFFLLELHFWQTALISVYYSAKLVCFPHFMFLWLKKKILTSPSLLVLAIDITLLVLALPFFWTVQLTHLKNSTEEVLSMDNPYNVFSMAVGCCLPFTVTLTCIGLNVRLLVSHVWRIKQNSSESSSSPQVRAHIRASTTMVLCAVVNLSLIISSVFLFRTKVVIGTMLHFFFCCIFMAHPTIQTIVLITGNSKLKSRLQIKCG